MGESTSTPRERLLAAARAVVERDGVEGLTLRSIAREAGVSHGAPLRHFPTLARLLAALAAEGFHHLVAAVDAELSDPAAPTDPQQRLARAGRAYVHVALSDPGVYAVMFRPDLCDTQDPAYLEAGAASFGQLVELVRGAQETGWHSDVPADRLAAVLWAQVHGIADLWLHGALQAVVAVESVDELLELTALARDKASPRRRSRSTRGRSQP